MFKLLQTSGYPGNQVRLSLYSLLIVQFILPIVPAQRVTKSTSPFSSPLASSSPSSSSSSSSFKCPYTSEDIFGVIFISVIVTIIVAVLALIILWLLWKRKLFPLTGNHFTQEIHVNNTNNQVTKQQKNGNLANDDKRDYKHLIKSLPPITNVFNHIANNCKLTTNKSMDDTFITTKPEQVNVKMTGHDFTGLGFNIQGNMRDGIFIKDVLTRGPASESGLIKPGDRIVNITVSFEKMVYEDALTILSYASPYDVTLQIEKSSKQAQANNNSTSQAQGYHTRRMASDSHDSLAGHELIHHPLFRSHSVEELRTTVFGDNSKHSISGEEPKTTGSVKSINVVLNKIKSSFLNRSTQSSKSNLSDKSKGVHQESDPTYSRFSLDPSGVDGRASRTSNYSSNSGSPKAKEIAIEMSPTLPVKGASPVEVKQMSPLKAIPEPVIKSDEIVIEIAPDESVNSAEIEEDLTVQSTDEVDLAEDLTSKKAVQGKRRAPDPPSIVSLDNKKELSTSSDHNNEPQQVINGSHNGQRSTSPGSQVEILAQVHQEQGNSEEDLSRGHSLSNISEIKSPAEDVSLSLAMDNTFSIDCEPTKPSLLEKVTKETSNQSAKPKSVSLSDLTLVKQQKQTMDLLERAVSLDLQGQVLPEENLNHPTNMEVSQGLLRWSDTRTSMMACDDSLSTSYSIEKIGFTNSVNEPSKLTNEATSPADASLKLPLDESLSNETEPEERPNLKRLITLFESKAAVTLPEKFQTSSEQIVAPPDEFRSPDEPSKPPSPVKGRSRSADPKVNHNNNISLGIVNSKSQESITSTKLSRTSKVINTSSPSSNSKLASGEVLTSTPLKIPLTVKKMVYEREQSINEVNESPTKVTMTDDVASQMQRIREIKEILTSSESQLSGDFTPKPTTMTMNFGQSGLKDFSKEPEETHKMATKEAKPMTIIINSNEIKPNDTNDVYIVEEPDECVNESAKETIEAVEKKLTWPVHFAPSNANKSKTQSNSPTIIPVNEGIDFESWSYISDSENNQLSLTSNETKHVTILDQSHETSPTDDIKKIPGVAGATIKLNEKSITF